MAKATVQIRIDPTVLEWVDEQARRNDRSRSWVINDLLSQFSRRDNDSQLHATTSQHN